MSYNIRMPKWLVWIIGIFLLVGLMGVGIEYMITHPFNIAIPISEFIIGSFNNSYWILNFTITQAFLIGFIFFITPLVCYTWIITKSLKVLKEHCGNRPLWLNDLAGFSIIALYFITFTSVLSAPMVGFYLAPLSVTILASLLIAFVAQTVFMGILTLFVFMWTNLYGDFH